MKPEKHHTGIRKIISKLFFFPVLLSLFIPSYSQNRPERDTIRSRTDIINPVYIRNIYPFPHGLSLKSGKTPAPPFNHDLTRTRSFLDTLKTRASKYSITRKLFDFVIVNKATGTVSKAENSSDAVFLAHSGKIIRNITIRRLNVFGTDIDNPDLYVPNPTEKLLNKTHVNSNENLIRKYLLFHEGDTLSPLTLSDNERLLRNLPYIDDARVIAIPAEDGSVDVSVITKDVFSLGARADLKGIKKGSVTVFDENIFGTGQEFGIAVPWYSLYPDSPGFGAGYRINNILSSFSNLDFYFQNGLGRRTYGFNLSRELVSSETRFAGGISLRRMSIYEDLESPIEPVPVKYTLQDYWLQRSFLLDRESVTRIVIGARYTNNNVFDHPFILPETYYDLQKYKLFLGSITFSMRKFYKANLIYSYGRTEDIPVGGSLNFTIGRENNEFKFRTYIGGSLSVGETLGALGYIQSSAGAGTFFNGANTEQGVFTIRTSFISRLYDIGNYRIRNFIKADYTRGFDRYRDEKLYFIKRNGFSGFNNDSIGNAQRLVVGFESVLFSPVNFYGFRFAGYFFADAGALYGLNERISDGVFLSSVGIGLRIRNDNLILNTFQIRFGYFPNPPRYSSTRPLIFSGEQLLEPVTFEPRPPSLLTYE